MNGIKLILLVVGLFAAILGLKVMKDGGLVAQGAPGAEPSLMAGLFGGPVNLMGEDKVTEPVKLRRAEFYGWKAKHPGVATANDGIVFLGDVVTGHPGIQRRQIPAAHRIAAVNTTCTPRPLAEGETLANVSVGTGDLDSGLQVFDMRTLAKDTGYWLDQSLRKSVFIDEDDIVGDHPVPMVDVILTDTSAPLYLVLQHWMGDIVWNIVPADGVEIAHIAMIGPGSAVNPPPGAYTLEFLDTATGCIPTVARDVRDSWDMFHRGLGDGWDDFRLRAARMLDSGDDALQAYLDSTPAEDIDAYPFRALARFRAYDAWFRDTYGQGAEDGVVGSYIAQHVLVGPMPATPDARVAYRPLDGSTVFVRQADFVFTGAPEQRHAALKPYQFDLLARAAGGDMTRLFPEPMFREMPQ